MRPDTDPQHRACWGGQLESTTEPQHERVRVVSWEALFYLKCVLSTGTESSLWKTFHA